MLTKALSHRVVRQSAFALLVAASTSLSGCGGGGDSATLIAPDAFTIGGTITGLNSDQQITLANNGGDALTLAGNGAFTFATPIARTGSYAVTVSSQPTGQVCSVAHGTGTDLASDVADVAVTCSNIAYSIGGNLTGLESGTQVTLTNNGGDTLTLTANGSFVFDTSVAYGGTYTVAISAQPLSFFPCTVSSGTGTVTANVSNVAVTCGPQTSH